MRLHKLGMRNLAGSCRCGAYMLHNSLQDCTMEVMIVLHRGDVGIMRDDAGASRIPC